MVPWNPKEWGPAEWIEAGGAAVGISGAVFAGAVFWFRGGVLGVDPITATALLFLVALLFWVLGAILWFVNRRDRRGLKAEKSTPAAPVSPPPEDDGFDWRRGEVAVEMRAAMLDYPDVAKRLRGIFQECLDADKESNWLFGSYLDAWLGEAMHAVFMDRTSGANQRGFTFEEYRDMQTHFLFAASCLIELHTRLHRLLNSPEGTKPVFEAQQRAFAEQEPWYVAFQEGINRAASTAQVRLEGSGPSTQGGPAVG